MKRFISGGSDRGRVATGLLACLLWIASAGPSRADVDAWPLFEHGERGTTVLYPFYVHEDDFLMLFPFYYRTNNGRDHHVLWPLVKVADGSLARLAPIWFKGEGGEFLMFPFIHQNEKRTIWFIPPIESRRDREYLAVYPLYARSPEMLYVFPYYRGIRGDRRFDYVFPLYSQVHDRKTGFRKHELFPLFSHAADPEHQAWATSALTFKMLRSPEERVDRLWPVYTIKYKRESSSEGDQGVVTRGIDLLWPLYHRETTRYEDGRLIARYRRFLLFTDRLGESGREFGLFGIPIYERDMAQ